MERNDKNSKPEPSSLTDEKSTVNNGASQIKALESANDEYRKQNKAEDIQTLPAAFDYVRTHQIDIKKIIADGGYVQHSVRIYNNHVSNITNNYYITQIDTSQKVKTKKHGVLRSAMDNEALRNLYTAKDFEVLNDIVLMPLHQNILRIFLLSEESKNYKYFNLVFYEKTNGLWAPSKEKRLKTAVIHCIRKFFVPFASWLETIEDLEPAAHRAGIRFLKKMDRFGIVKQIVCASYIILKDNNFGEKLDGDFTVIPFKTKVYSLDKRELRDYTNEDYFSKRFPLDYNPLADTSIAIKFIKSIFPDREVLDYALSEFASWLDFRFPNDYMLFFNGSGSNGKSLLIRLLSSIFGDFSESLPSNFFSVESDYSNMTNPMIKGLKTMRVAFLSNPEGNNLKSEFIKYLCRSNEISVWSQFSNEICKFKLTTKFVIAMEYLPSFSSVDQALWRRIRILPFTTKFVDNPKKKFEKKIDRSLSDNIEDNQPLKESLLKLLIEKYHTIKDINIEPPSACIQELEYIKSIEEEFKNWLEENVVYKQGKILSKNELFARYEGYPYEVRPLDEDQQAKLKIVNAYIEKLNDDMKDLIQPSQLIYNGRHKILGTSSTKCGYMNLWYVDEEEENNEDR
ncbi:primase [Vairimorpha necatrix]|uniref:Primase n=1 Tax=Vairimorpha necatrix TaxID=6039 RepID=A0AAX4JDJ6_9MICR